MYQIKHSDCGYIDLTGKNKVSALLTAYAMDEDAPVFVAFQATREVADAVRISFTANREIYMRGRKVKLPKKMYKLVSLTRLTQTQQTGMVVAHIGLNGVLVKDHLYIMRTVLDMTDAEEVFRRIEGLLPFPVFEQWRDHLWKLAISEKLIVPLTNQAGVSVFKVFITEKWQELLQTAVSGGAIPAISTIYNQEVQNVPA